MDAFELIVAQIFEGLGYWVRTGVKVELTKSEKVAIGRRSSPRWELDVVCYSPVRNEILAIECKSHLDSYGVRKDCFSPSSKHSKRFKLFVDDTLRRIVFGRLAQQWIEKGLCQPNPDVGLGLAAGKIYGPEEPIRELFQQQRFHFFGPAWLRDRLRSFQDLDYENQVAIMVAKLLLRN